MDQLDFPYHFSRNGRSADTGHADHVRDLIEQLLLTAPSERVMRPDFGAGLLALVFEPNSSALAATTQMLIQGALHQHLAQLIAVQAVELANDDGALRIDVRYILLRDGSQQSARIVAGAMP